MNIRVFIPSEVESDDETDFIGTEHDFPTMPLEGQILRFTDDREGDYKITRVGFIQDAGSFVPAVWTSERVDEGPLAFFM
jgi:hypothetical protein